NLPAGSPVNDFFPWGFVVRSPGVTPNSRTLPDLTADARTGESQYDGVVTFAFKIPLEARANKDPFKITLTFLVIDDSQTRITRSIEEAKYGGEQAFEQRATDIGATQVTLLGSVAYGGSTNSRTICGA